MNLNFARYLLLLLSLSSLSPAFPQIAFAQKPELSFRVFGGPGCPLGSITHESLNERAQRVKFFKMKVRQGQGIALSERRITCTIEFNIRPVGNLKYRMAVFRADGRANIPTALIGGNIATTLQVKDLGQVRSKTFSFAGPKSGAFDNPLLTTVNFSEPMGCDGRSRIVKMDTSLRLTSGAGPTVSAPADITLDALVLLFSAEPC